VFWRYLPATMGTHMAGTEASPARQPTSKWFSPIEPTLALCRTLFANHAYMRSLSQGAAFLAASLIAIVAAVSFATTNASNYVADLVLRNVGPYNMRFGFVYGTFLLFTVTIALLAWRPNRLPFALKAIALFLVVRAVFVSLTHIAPSPIDPQKPAPFFNSMFYGSDQFFSGHTGMPFLGALCFWHMRQWRYFYLAATAFFGAVVLLGHYHYSIDVLAALFITHGIFQIACWMFRQDFALFRSSELAAARKPKRAIRKKIDKWVEARRKGPVLVPEPEPFKLHAVGDAPPPAATGGHG
jgi:hypothetical protein